jgi:hypothetical protein
LEERIVCERGRALIGHGKQREKVRTKALPGCFEVSSGYSLAYGKKQAKPINVYLNGRATRKRSGNLAGYCRIQQLFREDVQRSLGNGIVLAF